MRYSQPFSILIIAHPGSKQERVEQKNGVLHVYVHAPAHEGMANEAVQKALATHFGVAKSVCRLIKGKTSKQKIFSIG